MTDTLDGLKETQPSWAAEVRAIEKQKRHAVDERILYGPPLTVTNGFLSKQERVFDPVLQRYRAPEVELSQRVREENERTKHLNRALDVQILREQSPYNFITHASRLEGLGLKNGIEKQRPASITKYPDTCVDYNILSNLPANVHHWAKPELRPVVRERAPKAREVPANSIKDYHIITNKYLEGHEEKRAREKELHLLEAAQKYRKHNRMDPLNQQLNDPREENLMQTADDARQVEVVERQRAQLPPSYRVRPSEHYNFVTHEVYDPDVLRWQDFAEDERHERYKNRYIVEHNIHVQDVRKDRTTELRKLQRVAPERFEEERRRGFDIVTNERVNGGFCSKKVPSPNTKVRPTAWQKVEGAPPGTRASRSLRTSASAPALQGQHTAARGSLPEAQAATLRPEATAAKAGVEEAAAAAAAAAPTNARPKSGTSRRMSEPRLPSAPAASPSMASGTRARHSDMGGRALSEASSRRRSDVAAAAVPPPPPRIPGSPSGSVFSRPRP